MSSNSVQPNQSNDMIENTKETAMAAADRVDRAANSSGEQAQQNKEEAAGFLQQTGEQVKSMAQGAMDSVKQTLGMDKK